LGKEEVHKLYFVYLFVLFSKSKVRIRASLT